MVTVIRRAFPIVAAAYVMLLVAQTFFSPFAEMKLFGSEPPLPELRTDAAAFADGSLRRALEDRLQRGLGFRGLMVRVDNQLSLSLFGELKAGKLVLGLDDQVFERVYINTLNCRDSLPDEELRRKVLAIKELRLRLNERKKELLFVISPSKATIYSDKVPDKYKLDPSVRRPCNYPRVIRMLEEEGVPYVDGKVFYEHMWSGGDHRPFPKGGVHWSFHSSYYFTHEMLDRLSALMGRNIVMPEPEFWRDESIPEGSDGDIGRMANVFDEARLRDDNYQYPEFDKNKGHYMRPVMLIVGGSFSEHISDTLANSGAVNLFQWLERYKSRSFFYAGGQWDIRPITEEPSAASIGNTFYMLNPDIVIIENNEQSLGNIGFGFLEDALEGIYPEDK